MFLLAVLLTYLEWLFSGGAHQRVTTRHHVPQWTPQTHRVFN